MTRLLLLSLALSACSSSTVITPVRRPDGGWHLKCHDALEACVQQATDLCKDRGFVVLGGMSKRTLYGAELGVSQVAVREGQLDIACADHHGELPNVIPAAPDVSASAPSPAPAPPAAPVAGAVHGAACTPGSTQRCVGAGACAGGQSCATDGSGYSACDCGSSASKTP